MGRFKGETRPNVAESVSETAAWFERCVAGYELEGRFA